MSSKQKFGVEEEIEISDLWVPRNSSMLEVERSWGNRTASSE